jgi:hypothetical protein
MRPMSLPFVPSSDPTPCPLPLASAPSLEISWLQGEGSGWGLGSDDLGPGVDSLSVEIGP